MTDESLKEEILVNVTPNEVRAALLENGVLQEVYIERAARRGVISNIYKGRVSRVLPGMQAAFVEIGLQRTAFLHVSDIARTVNGEDADVELPNIRDLVREGDDVLVQVVKDPLGNKGARLTTFITLPSRNLVLLPKGDSVGISARIEDETERERLREAVAGLLEEAGLRRRGRRSGRVARRPGIPCEAVESRSGTVQQESGKKPDTRGSVVTVTRAPRSGDERCRADSRRLTD